MSLHVLVLGATGRFGEVTTLLLKRGHRVRALRRDPRSARARTLEALGARIVPGDYDDPASLASAVVGVDGSSRAARHTGPVHRKRYTMD